jgi:hypothetical protein
MPEAATAEVLNHDVDGIYRRLNRFIVEARDSTSAGMSQITASDLARLKTYTSSILAYVGWVAAQPELDLPETAPRRIALDAAPAVKLIENDDLADVLKMMIISRDEVVNSQSARRAAGMIPFDRRRLEDVVKKIDDFLANYVAKISPLDLPESSPMRDLSTPGRTGI